MESSVKVFLCSHDLVNDRQKKLPEQKPSISLTSSLQYEMIEGSGMFRNSEMLFRQ